MAEKSKMELRDPVPSDDKPYLTKSAAQRDLEARLGREAESVYPQAVNPNPVGATAEHDGDEVGFYVGTDPIYQNSSTVHGVPFAAQDGVEQEVEEALFDEHDLSDVDDSEKAADYGLGGEALKVGERGGDTFRTILPGQEGYDKERAEAQNGQPMQVWGDEQPSEKSEEDGDQDAEVAQADNEGTNFGSTVTPPPEVEAVGDESEGAGNRPAKKAAAKGQSSS